MEELFRNLSHINKDITDVVDEKIIKSAGW